MGCPVSRSLDLLAFGDERRLGPFERELFGKMRGKILMVAAETGNDFQFFPTGRVLPAIDISPGTLERAAPKAAAYDGMIELREMDVCELPFEDASFKTIEAAR